MKLREIYLLCKENYASVDVKVTVDFENDNMKGKAYVCSTVREIENLERTHGKIKSTFMNRLNDSAIALQALINIKFLHELVNDLLKIINKIPMDYRWNQKDSRRIFMEFFNKKEYLLNKMKCIIGLYESMGLNTDQFIGLDIKLPASNDFTEFKKNIDDLEFIFTKCPFFQHESESLKFQNVDVGSTWLTFIVTGVIGVASVLLNNIAAFIDKCLLIKRHHLENEQRKKELEYYKIEQKEKETIIKYLNTNYKKVMEIAIKELETITGHEIADRDEMGRVEQTFERSMKLLDKGLQIYSTIDSPKQTKELFEPLKMKYLEMDKQLKLLEEREQDTSDNEN